jgi:uncharacterized protein (TIGR03000 family)
VGYGATPPLEPGVNYRYTLKAELARDGEVQTVTQTVRVRGGETTLVKVEFPTAAVAGR